MLLKISSLAELQKDLTRVTELKFTGVKIGPKDIKSLFVILSDNSQITSLALGGIRIGDDSAKAIATELATNNTLTSIDLILARVGVYGAKAIAAALKENNTLTSIGLSYNELVGVDGAKAIAAALEDHKTLTSIDLEGNNIDDEGAKAIATVLETNRTLTSINLGNNRIGDDGAKAIVSALKTNKTLTFIDLDFNQFKLDSTNAILSALARNKVRKDLVEEFTQKDIAHISVQSISDELLERLKAALPILRELKEKGVGSEVLSEVLSSVIKSENFELCSHPTSAIITNVIKYFMEHLVYDNAVILAGEYTEFINYTDLFTTLTFLPRPDPEAKDDYYILCQIILGHLDDFATNESYLEAVEMPLVRDLAMYIKDKLAGTTLSEEYKALVTKVMTTSFAESKELSEILQSILSMSTEEHDGVMALTAAIAEGEVVAPMGAGAQEPPTDI